MKILHVIPSMNPKYGGPAQGIRNYEYGLKGKNVQRHIVCFDDPESVKGWLAGDLKVVSLGSVNNRWQNNSKLKSWLYENATKYNAIVINGIWLYHSYATINIINKLKSKGKIVPKVFVMPHGMLDPWFQTAKIRGLKRLRNSIYWHLIEKKVIYDADGLLFTCQEELELAKTTFNDYHPKSVKNIGYGIAPPPAYTEAMKTAFNVLYANSASKPYLLFMSRVHPKKGLDLLLDAYEKILKNKNVYNTTLTNLVVAGPGLDTDYGKEMLQKVNRSPALKERVHFTDMISGDTKWGAIYGCEAFILPSHQENFGIAVAEALACAKPVLISNQVNIWKEVESVNAGIINPDTVEGTIKSLETFFSLSESERNKMKEQALIAYQQFFDVQVTADNFIQAIS